MKSSTLRRSNLSKEKMAVLEALSNYRQEVKEAETTPEVYERSNNESSNNKEHELDVLWQNFKISQKTDKSPGIYLGMGFLAGVVATLIVIALMGGFSAKKTSADDLSLPTTVSTEVAKPVSNVKPQEKKKAFTLIPKKEEKKAETATPENKMYQVKNGDTMSSILIHFYGRATKEREIRVLNANGMSNPNKLTAGEKIRIPMEK